MPLPTGTRLLASAGLASIRSVADVASEPYPMVPAVMFAPLTVGADVHEGAAAPFDWYTAFADPAAKAAHAAPVS